MMKLPNKNTVFVVLVIAIALSIGLWRNKQVGNVQPTAQLSNITLAAGTPITSARTLPEFELLNSKGEPFTNQQLKDGWSLVFFGYSHCPYICPKTLETLKDIADRVGPQPNLQYVFISIDPHRDTPERLTQYLTQPRFKTAHTQTNILGVTGDAHQIQELAHTIGIYISQSKEKNNPNNPHASQEIDHSGTLVLINPKGEMAAVFSNPDNPGAISQDLKTILQQGA